MDNNREEDQTNLYIYTAIKKAMGNIKESRVGR